MHHPHADVTQEDQVERAIAETVKELGRIDYVANFAGVIGYLGQPTWETPTDLFRKVVDIDLLGAWLCVKHGMAQMSKQDSIAEGIEEGRVPQPGSIVNFASVNSIQSGFGMAGYTAAKHGVVGMTKAAALEGRAHNIRVNAVSPDCLKTDLFDLPEELFNALELRQGRSAKPEEVGDAVVLLSIPRMSLVNGENLSLDKCVIAFFASWNRAAAAY